MPGKHYSKILMEYSDVIKAGYTYTNLWRKPNKSWKINEWLADWNEIK